MDRLYRTTTAEVYVIPAEGGVPRRLTYTANFTARDDIPDRMGPNNIVMTWRDNESIGISLTQTKLQRF